MLILNLALADMIVTAMIDPFNVVGKDYSVHFYSPKIKAD